MNFSPCPAPVYEWKFEVFNCDYVTGRRDYLPKGTTLISDIFIFMKLLSCGLIDLNGIDEIMGAIYLVKPVFITGFYYHNELHVTSSRAAPRAYIKQV